MLIQIALNNSNSAYQNIILIQNDKSIFVVIDQNSHKLKRISHHVIVSFTHTP